MAERLSFDLVANDAASAGFAAAGRSAAAASDDVLALGKRLDEIGKKSAKAKVGLEGDKDADLKLDQLSLKLLRLGRTVVRPDISVDGFLKATIEVKALEIEMDKLDKKSASISASGGGLSKLRSSLAGLFSVAAGAGGSAGQGGGGILGAFGDFIGSPAGAVATIAVVAAAAAPLLVEADGLVSGFAAAGAGVAAFGLLALPTFRSIATAYTGISAAQAKYQAALAAEKQDPTKANAAAVTKALDALKVAQQNLSPSTKTAVGGIDSLMTEYHKLSAAFAPDALKVFNDALGIANTLLPDVKPFADDAATAIDGLLKKAGQFFKSADFHVWLASFETDTGPALTAIGDGFGKVAVSAGKLLTIMSSRDQVHAINILFDTIAGTITATGDVIRGLMVTWDVVTGDIKLHGEQLATFFTKTLPTGFDEFRAEAREVWDQVEIDVLKMKINITGTMGELPGPLGAPFRAAHKQAQTELAGIQGDVAATAARINADWQKLHDVNINVHGKGSFTVFQATTGLQGKAAGGLITGGTPGRDSVLAALMPGEVVVPTRMVSAGAVDHLRGQLPGFASGGVVGSYAGSVPGLGPWMGGEAAATAKLIEVATAAATSVAAAAAARAARAAVSAGGAPGGAAIGAGAAAAQAYARSILHDYGWGLTMFPPLQSLWNGESGWNYKAYNAASGATGIPQSLPGDKMASAGADWRTNPATQIRWGLGYIKGRYGNPATAYSDWLARSPHWYDKGGYLPPGPSVAFNGTGRAEVVSTQADMRAMIEELKAMHASMVVMHKGIVGAVAKVAPGVNHGLNSAARGVITR